MANLISIGRCLLAVVVCAALLAQNPQWLWPLFGLTVAVIWLDGLDGYVARKLNESSVLGAVIDILSDRAVEQIYWITFLALGWVPWWVPAIVILRGIWVDGLRGIALEKGYTAFGSSTLMRSWLGVLLVSSRASRWSYAVLKAAAFALMILAAAPGGYPDLLPVAMGCVYGAVIFCVLRGLPVLVEVRRLLNEM